MSLKFWLGPSGSGKSTKLYNYMIEESIKNPDRLYYIIVPEQANLKTQQDLVRLHPRKGILNIDVLSFNRLAHRVFEETGYGRDGGRVIDDMGKNLILRRVSQLYSDELPMLGENLGRLGYVTQVKSVISEFMQYGIDKDVAFALSKEAEEEHRGQLSGKLKDISFLYEKFLEFIKDHYTTREELMIRLSKTLPESQKIKRTIIAFDGFTGFTPVQLEVIEQLLILCPEVNVVLNLDKRGDRDNIRIEEHELFYMSRHTISQLGKIADENHIMQDDQVIIDDDIPARFTKNNIKASDDNDSEIKDSMLVHLEKNLFRERPEASKLNDGSISILSALNPDEELEQVASKISTLIREKDFRYNEIAIITGDIELYRSNIERALSKHEIPYFTDKTQAILLNPMVEYLRGAISVLSENYTYESVFRLLKTGLVDIDREDIDEFENYIIAMGIKGRSKYQRVFSGIPKIYSRLVPEERAKYLNRINVIRQKVVDVFAKIEGDISDKFNAGSRASVKTFATAFYNMLCDGKIYSKLASRADFLRSEGKEAQAKNYDQIYERTLNVFEQMVELLGDEKLTVKEFGQLLDAGLDEIRIGVIPATTDFVQVGDITRSRIGDVKALFVVGANDGLIPQGASSGGLLSDEDKEFFIKKHSDISFAPTARENAYTQRLYLYMTFTKPSDYLFISYSKINQAGESVRPSYIIRTIQKMFENVKTEAADSSVLAQISDKGGSFAIIPKYFEAYKSGLLSDEESEAYEGLVRFYCDDSGYKEMLNSILYGDDDTDNGLVSKAVAKSLYTDKLNTSITKLEAYAKCAYAYFLQYGLRLNEREVFDFAASDLGNVFHKSLEAYTNMLKKRGIAWNDITDEDAMKLMDEAVEYAVASDNLAVLYSTRRQAFMVHRIKRIMRRTASVLKYQSKKGKFTPHSVEVDFNEINDLEALNLSISDEESMRLFGRIDRIDTCTEGNTTYVRVIDYKSGNTDLEIDAVYEGRQLQLVVYMDTALEMIKRITGGTTVPAGILYYHIDDPIIKSEDIDDISQIEAEIRKKLKMSGYVNSDRHIVNLMDAEFDAKSDIIPVTYKKDGEPAKGAKLLSTQQFEELRDGARRVMTEIGKGILSGDIKTAKERGDLEKYPDTCDYCDFKYVCHQRKIVQDKENAATEEDIKEESSTENIGIMVSNSENISRKEDTAEEIVLNKAEADINEGGEE